MTGAAPPRAAPHPADTTPVKPSRFLATTAALLLAACQPTTPVTPPPIPPSASAKPTPRSTPVAKVKSYPLATCAVTEEPLDEWDEQITYLHGTQEMKFCCKMCLKKFKANPDKYLAKLP